ncbi:lectizyme-like [Condylostylus longicornis]|uniref:lectizyme-like n=1 Tax=Condylostylus longicornis TaxID=2530218 RepID=UPI00244E0817|nr:lectizyme-like [Condylostylus longicornis]
MKTIFIIITFGLLSTLAYPQNNNHNDDDDEFYIGFPEDDISINRGRIISGKDAEPHSAPYIVSIREGENGAHICGGSILTKNTILTAAHCLKSNLYVAVGLHDRRDTTNSQIIKVKNYIGHDNYKGGSSPYDIGVLHLSEPIKLNDNTIKPIDLPITNEKQTGEVTLYGWGRTIANSWNLPNILQVVTTDLLTNEECLNELPDKDKKNLHNTMICTGSRNEHISSCNADSGGPLVQKNNDNKTILVGLVSWGVLPCGKANKPSVYTHIGSHLDWIKINTRK